MNKQLFHTALISTCVSAFAMLHTSVSSAHESRHVQSIAQDLEARFRHDPSRHRMVPRLYDAHGQVVGDVVLGSDNGDGGDVLLDIEGVLVLVSFGRIGGVDGTRSASQMEWRESELHFGGPHCTGEPYTRYTGTPLRPTAAYSQNSHVVLYIAVDGPQEEHRLVSSGDSSGCYLDGFVDTVWRVERSIDLTEKYPGPLRVGW